MLISKHNPNNAYNGRFRWWYESIADWMLANPGGKQKDCAEALGKGQATISLIMNSDAFKAYYNKRRADYREAHDDAIIGKQRLIAETAMDSLLQTLEKKRDQVPISQLADITDKTLARLGYGPTTGPQVVVNNNTQSNLVMASVSKGELEIARERLRQAEEARLGKSSETHSVPHAPVELLPPPPSAHVVIEQAAELQSEEIEVRAPSDSLTR